MSHSLASQVCVHILSVVKSLGLDLDGLALLRGDNQGAIKLVENRITHVRTKHMDIRYDFARDLVEREAIQFQFVPGDQNVQGNLTKAFGSPKISQFRCDLFSQSVHHHSGGVGTINEYVHSQRCLQTCGLDTNSIINSSNQKSTSQFKQPS